MKPYTFKIFTILTLAAILFPATAAAQGKGDKAPIRLTDSVQIVFPQSKWDLVPGLGDNAAALDGIGRRLTTLLGDSVYRVRHVTVCGGASPEGSVDFNRFLSEKRAATLFGWFDRFRQLSATERTFMFFGRDWEGVLRLAEQDASLPYREETLTLLRAVATEKRTAEGKEPAGSLERVKRLRGGLPYRYLYSNVFPNVRASKVVIDYELVPAPEEMLKAARPDTVIRRDTVYIERVSEVRDTVYVDTCKRRRRQ